MLSRDLARTLPCLALAAACAATPELPRVRSDRFELRGYSFRAPAGPWYELPTGSPLLPVLTRSGWSSYAWRDRARATSAVFEAGDAPGREGVWEAYRRARREFHEGSQFKVVAERFEPAEGPGKDCIRLETTFEFWVRRTPLRTRGLACRHPASPDVAVALLGTVRADAVERGAEAELEGFLASLAFTRERPVAIASSSIQSHGTGRILAFAPGAGTVWAAAAGKAYALDPRSVAASHMVSVPLLVAPELVRGAAVAETAGSIWIATEASVAASLASAGTGEGEAVTIAHLRSPRWIAEAGGAVFVGAASGLYRIRPGEGELTRVRSGAHAALAAAGDLLWALDEEKGAYVALDAASGAERGPAIPLPAKPAILAVAPDALVLVDGGGQVLRIDTSSRQVTRVIALDSAAAGACVRRGALWLSLPDEGVLRAIDPSSGLRIDELPFRASAPLLCDGDAIWTATRVGALEEVVRLAP